MEFESIKYKTYLIKQITNQKNIVSFKIHSTTEETIKNIVDILIGRVEVYIHNSLNNSRIDKTKELGREEILIDKDKKYYKYNLSFKSIENLYMRIKDIYLYEGTINNKDITIEEYYNTEPPRIVKYKVYKADSTSVSYSVDYQKKEKAINTKKGSEYELFIGKKYEGLGKKVIYNGIEKGLLDNGIDLIVEDENAITLIQCKNWSSLGNRKINNKELRAFLGDGYRFKIESKTEKKLLFHFIISDENLLTDCGKRYLKDVDLIKYKIVPFEE